MSWVANIEKMPSTKNMESEQEGLICKIEEYRARKKQKEEAHSNWNNNPKCIALYFISFFFGSAKPLNERSRATTKAKKKIMSLYLKYV